MNTIVYTVMYIISTFFVSAPIPPYTEYHMEFTNDTVIQQYNDSCIAYRCFENIAWNIPNCNSETHQLIIKVEITKDTIP